MGRLLETHSSNKRIVFDNDDRFDETIDIDGRLYTIQDLVFTQLSHDNVTTGTHHIKWSPITKDQWIQMHEPEWLSYKYSIMQTELDEDGSRLTPLEFTITTPYDTIKFNCGKLERPGVNLDPNSFTSINALSEDDGTNIQDEDFRWYIENFSQLYDQYGSCYVAIKNKAVIGVYDSFAKGVLETQKTEEAGTFIIQQCAKSFEECIEYIS